MGGFAPSPTRGMIPLDPLSLRAVLSKSLIIDIDI